MSNPTGQDLIDAYAAANIPFPTAYHSLRWHSDTEVDVSIEGVKSLFKIKNLPSIVWECVFDKSYMTAFTGAMRVQELAYNTFMEAQKILLGINEPDARIALPAKFKVVCYDKHKVETVMMYANNKAALEIVRANTDTYHPAYFLFDGLDAKIVNNKKYGEADVPDATMLIEAHTALRRGFTANITSSALDLLNK